MQFETGQNPTTAATAATHDNQVPRIVRLENEVSLVGYGEDLCHFRLINIATQAIANIVIRPFAEYETRLLGRIAATTDFLSFAATDAGSYCELLMGLDQLLSPFIGQCLQVRFNAPPYRNCAHLRVRLRPRNLTTVVLVHIPKEALIWVVDLEFEDANNPWNRLV
jgi:hypothetical protein